MTLKNTEKIYRIEVVNQQVIDGEKGTVTETAMCGYTQKNGKVYIRYKTCNDGADVSTTIITDGDTVSIKRSGAVSSAMIFKKNSNTQFIYHMPYGSMEMEICTHELISSLSDDGGELRICYILTAQGEKYENNITINITEGEMDEI